MKDIQEAIVNIDRLKGLFQLDFRNRGWKWSDGLYQNTLVNCMEVFKDKPDRFLKYFWKSLQNNYIREQQYSPLSKKDDFITIPEVSSEYRYMQVRDNLFLEQPTINQQINWVYNKIEQKFGSDTLDMFIQKYIKGRDISRPYIMWRYYQHQKGNMVPMYSNKYMQQVLDYLRTFKKEDMLNDLETFIPYIPIEQLSESLDWLYTRKKKLDYKAI